MRTPGVLAVAVAVVLAAGCEPETPAPGGWVVESVGYHGQRGGPGVHFVTCVHSGDRDRWRDVVVPKSVANSIEDGAPCPPGPVRMSSDGTGVDR